MLDIAQRIEHTVLKPETSPEDIRRICEEAMQFRVAGVCVPPYFVRDARRVIPENSRIKIVTVVGFPMGYTGIAAKSEEIKRAVDDQVDEIDAVVNIAAIKSDHWNHVYHDIDSLARATHMKGRTLKLIVECALLTDEELAQVCKLANEAQIAYIKTGTGFHHSPVTPAMVTRLRALAPNTLKIKAAGGIRSAADALALIEAGADRLGTSSAPLILGVVPANPPTL